jgi:hypothetical protein
MPGEKRHDPAAEQTFSSLQFELKFISGKKGDLCSRKDK